MTDKRPGFELIIVSYNRPKVLSATVRAVRAMYPELLICLGLQGDAREFMQEIEKEPVRNLRILTFNNPGTTMALNACIASSPADVALIIDDDAAPCSGWLESHAQAFLSDPGLFYTCGREIRVRSIRPAYADSIRLLFEAFFRKFLPRDVSLQGRIVGWTSSTGLIFGNFNQPGTCRINTPRGCNMAVRIDALAAIGGFSNSFRGNAWGFEADFGLRIAQQGGYGRYVGAAAVLHFEFPSGGSRQGNRLLWYRDYLHNHRILIGHLGPQAWIGALPRLVKKAFWLMVPKR